MGRCTAQTVAEPTRRESKLCGAVCTTVPTRAARKWRARSAQRDTETARGSPRWRRAPHGSCVFAASLIPEPMTRSTRNWLNAFFDLIFDALPDLVVAHVRIF